jgi:hypothetical protein
MLIVLQVSPETIRYEPYPKIEMPHVNLVLIAGSLALMLPAFFAPPPELDAEVTA